MIHDVLFALEIFTVYRIAVNQIELISFWAPKCKSGMNQVEIHQNPTVTEKNDTSDMQRLVVTALLSATVLFQQC